MTFPRFTSACATLGLAFVLPAPHTNASDTLAIEEVVVTARKREESLQDVPVAVSAFSAQAMEQLGIRNMRDLDGLVPGLHLGEGGNGVKGDGNAYIRGVGQRETRVTIDSGVGIYLDDVYIARASGALLDTVEMESVQVLRGPQGTLFGKNTTGGAILYRSVMPGAGFSGQFKGTYGNLGRRDASLSVSVPLVEDTLLSQWTLASVKNDGHVENALDGTDFTDDDRKIGIAQLRWLPTDDLAVDFSFNHTKTDQRPTGLKCDWLGDELAAAGLPNEGSLEFLYNIFSPISVQEYCERSGDDLPLDEFEGEYNKKSNVFRLGKYEVTANMAYTTVNWELDDAMSLKSITAYRNTEQVADEDLDGMDAVIIGRLSPNNNDTDQYSQEFQLIGSALDERIDYTVGLYGFYEETNDDWLQDFAGFVEYTTAPNSILLARSNLTERETENTAWAAFGQMDYNFSEELILTLGLRYTWEERKTSYREARVYLPSVGQGNYLGELDTIYGANVIHRFDAPGANPAKTWQYGFDPDGPGGRPFEVGAFGELSDDRNDDDWSPMAGIKYLPGEEVLDSLGLDGGMAYLTYASGFRSGGVSVGNGDFDGDQIIDLENYKPETVDMIELGFKIDALNRRLRTNVAIYYQEYDDIQLTTTIADPELGVPLPAIDNAGKAEISGVEAEFTFLPTAGLRFIGSVAYMDAEYKEYMSEVPNPDGPGQVAIDRSDEPMPRAPEWTAFLSVDYFFNTDSWGTFIPSALARYSDELYGGFDRESFVVADEITADAVTFYDARIAWQLPDDRTTITAWCDNITDKDDHMVAGVPTVGVARTTSVGFSRPRTYGIDVTYNFGAR